MKTALSLLALLQLTVLPGLLLTRRFRFDSVLPRIMGVTTISLLVNYALVLLLTSLHQYRQSNVWLILGAELAALAWCYWKDKPSQTAPQPPAAAPSLSPGGIAAATVTLLLLALHIWQWSNEWPKVFQSFDAIASWNRWAIEWSGNAIPRDTATYPQLLPISWSLVYLIAGGAEGELFARMLMGLFTTLVLLSVLTLQLHLRKPWLALSSLAGLLFIILVIEKNRFDGMADVPAASLSFVGVCFLILAREDAEERYRSQWLLLASAALGAGCATKQAGLMIGVLSLVWALTDSRIRQVGRDAGKRGLWALGLFVLCAAHWQIVGLFLSRLTQDTKLVEYLVHDIHEGRNGWQRFLYGTAQIQRALAPAHPLGLVSLVSIIASALHPLGRRVLLHLALPAALIWVFAFSYDARNLAAALPPAALCMGFGAETLASWVTAGMARLRQGILWQKARPWVLPSGTALALLIALFVSDDALSSTHRAARRRAGDEAMNRAVSDHMSKTDTVISAYVQLRIQPGINKRVFTYAAPLADASTAEVKLKDRQWLVIESRLPTADDAMRQQLIREGRLKECARTATWVLYQIIDTAAKPPQS